jgi:hypothetical protein
MIIVFCTMCWSRPAWAMLLPLASTCLAWLNIVQENEQSPVRRSSAIMGNLLLCLGPTNPPSLQNLTPTPRKAERPATKILSQASREVLTGGSSSLLRKLSVRDFQAAFKFQNTASLSLGPLPGAYTNLSFPYNITNFAATSVLSGFYMPNST